MVCDISTSIYNRVIETRLEEAAVEEGIMEVVNFYSSKGLPFLWMVGPEDSPPDLSRRLEESGFVRSGSPGMAMDLSLLREPAAPPGFRLEPVQDEDAGLENRRRFHVRPPQPKLTQDDLLYESLGEHANRSGPAETVPSPLRGLGSAPGDACARGPNGWLAGM